MSVCLLFVACFIDVIYFIRGWGNILPYTLLNMRWAFSMRDWWLYPCT